MSLSFTTGGEGVSTDHPPKNPAAQPCQQPALGHSEKGGFRGFEITARSGMIHWNTVGRGWGYRVKGCGGGKGRSAPKLTLQPPAQAYVNTLGLYLNVARLSVFEQFFMYCECALLCVLCEVRVSVCVCLCICVIVQVLSECKTVLCLKNLPQHVAKATVKSRSVRGEVAGKRWKAGLKR